MVKGTWKMERTYYSRRHPPLRTPQRLSLSSRRVCPGWIRASAGPARRSGGRKGHPTTLLAPIYLAGPVYLPKPQGPTLKCRALIFKFLNNILASSSNIARYFASYLAIPKDQKTPTLPPNNYLPARAFLCKPLMRTV